MRTCSKATNTNKPGTSCSHANTTNPPPEPTLDDAVTALMNASADSARILQVLAQDEILASQGCPSPVVNNTYADFLKTHPPVFLKADELLEVDYWIRTIQQKFGLIYCDDVQKTLFVAQ